jgi:hypothetical protein
MAEPTPKPTAAPQTFSGTIVDHFPGEFTICVSVDGYAGEAVGLCSGMGPGVKQVCYEFAEVIPGVEALQVGEKVDVTIHQELGKQGDTYFAERVAVVN